MTTKLMQRYQNRRGFFRAIGVGASMALTARAFGQYLLPPGQIRLIFNENPYGPSPKALQEVEKILPLASYYADSPNDFPIRDKLINEIAKLHDLEEKQLLISSGSNEALQAVTIAYGKIGKILIPSLTYSDHISYAERLGVEVVRIPLRADLQVDLRSMAKAVDDSISMVYLANPNNPTGIAINSSELREFCKEVGERVPVVIDEAYNEFTDNPNDFSMVDLVRGGDNVLITRTFSKIFGMAGMRVGYAMGHFDILEQTNLHIMAWLNGVGLTAAYHSYRDAEFIRFSRDKVLIGREKVNRTFKKLNIKPVPSQTNFVFADIGRDGKDFAAELARFGVLIRGGFEGYSNYVRVSMGRLEDLEVFDEMFTRVYLS